MTEAVRRPSTRRSNQGGVIDAVRAGSVAEEVGLEAGDRIVSINGHPLRDAVDYQFHASEETLAIEIVRGSEAEIVEIEKDADTDIGIDFQDPAFDGVRTCNNSCFFCFLKGNPRGMRKTLYVKDDDYRLSFFHGNFVTLTNLEEEDWHRIGQQALSPLNVSVHATDIALRRYLLGNKTAPDIVAQLQRLAALGIEAHTQVVLCPGVNDGSALDRTIADLMALYPTVQTISVVPVGETRTAEERILRGLHAGQTNPCTPEYARAVIAQVGPYQQQARREHGRTLVYLADEFYVAARMPLPPSAEYDGFPQYENGIGMTRSLLDDWRRVRRRFLRDSRRPAGTRSVSLVCGTLIADTLHAIARELRETTNVDVRVHVIENTFFGPRVNVSGLLVSRDIERELTAVPPGDICVLPRYALDYTGHRFLDDRTPLELQTALGVPVAFASTMSDVLQILYEPVESQAAVTGAVAHRSNGKAWVDWAREASPVGGRGLAKEVRR